jgi:hypothetical protein
MIGALAVAVAGSSVFVALPAYADGGTPTTITVTTTKPTIMSGQPVVFKANVSPSKIGKTKVTGTMTFTITGKDGSTVSCASVSPLNGGGNSTCKVGKAEMLAGSAPYTVSAAYSGDANFAAGSGSATETVVSANTRVRIIIAVKPTSGASTTIQAYVKGGPGTPALSGLVTFAVASGLSARGVKTYCEGSATPPTANNSQPIVGGFATCTLPAGWFVVPAASSAYKHPRTSWAVSASYNGNGSFLPITASLHGFSNH